MYIGTTQNVYIKVPTAGLRIIIIEYSAVLTLLAHLTQMCATPEDCDRSRFRKLSTTY